MYRDFSQRLIFILKFFNPHFAPPTFLTFLLARKSSCGKLQEASRPRRNQSRGGGGAYPVLSWPEGYFSPSQGRISHSFLGYPPPPPPSQDWGTAPWKGHGTRGWDTAPPGPDTWERTWDWVLPPPPPPRV